jgi:hypothetical protein
MAGRLLKEGDAGAVLREPGGERQPDWTGTHDGDVGVSR